MTETSDVSRGIGGVSEAPSQIALSDTLLDCKVCHDIWRGFADHNAIFKISLGSFEDAVLSECPRHTPLVERFRDYCQNRESMIRGSDDVGIRADRSGHGIQLIESISKGGGYWSLLLVKQNSVSDPRRDWAYLGSRLG